MTEIGGLDEIRPVLEPLAERFNRRGHRLFLVGGAVRDLLLAETGPAGAGFRPDFDLDMTTDARPDVIKELLAPGADALWAQGERFGTIGARVGGHDLEVTTHRAEAYDPESRKPVVSFGDDLGLDLSRRDFTINAMAIEIPGDELHDPYGGLADLEGRVLQTPLSPEVSFTDDPLRMLRAARFVTRFGLTARPELISAATELADRLNIVSIERVNDELERLLLAGDPGPGLDFLRGTGLLAVAVPGLDEPDAADLAVRLASVEVADDTALVRRAGLLWPLGPAAPAALARLRYSNDDRRLTGRLLATAADLVRPGATEAVAEVAAGVAAGPGSEPGRPAFRRAVVSIGVDRIDSLLELLANLGRHDPAVDRERVSAIVALAHRLADSEDLSDLGSPLSGAEIMATLGIEPGPGIGRAQRYLASVRLDHGPVGPSDARDLLVRWWRQESGT